MKLLLTSDLHCDPAKLNRFQKCAPDYDVMLVAGDLLDMFSPVSLEIQSRKILKWRDSIVKTGKSVAWCSGNHDFFDYEQTPMDGPSPLWMQQKASGGCALEDCYTTLLKVGPEHLIITTLPWPAHGGMLFSNGKPITYHACVDRVMHEGQKLRVAHDIPWFVLCHEPPSYTAIAGSHDSREGDYFRRLIRGWEPNFSLHGHIHHAPFAEGGSWQTNVGRTVCFNAGQSERGALPYYIELDIPQCGVWRGTEKNWTAKWSGEQFD